MRESVCDCSRVLQLKKTGLMLVAYRSRPEETKAMRDAFKAYDIDQNGLVSREEFINVLRSQGYTDEEVRGSWNVGRRYGYLSWLGCGGGCI